ncbi:MAG TPA: retropepsin-like aspartic protease [Anaerolineae bacterium]|nr:retropepsin-like aspartic protease [Anaerolineae bacterium]
MQLTLKDDLPFVRIGLAYAGREVEIDDVLVDTASASTVLGAHTVAALGIQPDTEDVLYTIRGVGGTETVYLRRVQALRVGRYAVKDVEIEIGGMQYGFAINGILGMDLLRQVGAVIDLGQLIITFQGQL